MRQRAQVPLQGTSVENMDLTRLYPNFASSYNRCKADVAQLVEQSIRNRQVIGSSPIVGSSKVLCFIHLVATLAANTFVCVVNCVGTVFLRTHITL